MPMDNTILEVASAHLQNDYRNTQVFKLMTNTDYEGEVGLGKPLKIFTAPIPDDEDYVRGTTSINYQDVTPAEQIFTPDQYRVFGLKADDLEARFARKDVWERTMRNGAWRLAQSSDTYISTGMVAAVATTDTTRYLGAFTVGLGLNSNAFELMVNLEKALENLDVPLDDVHVAVPPDYEGFLIKDGRYTSFNTAEAVKNLRGQNIGQARSLTVHKTTAVPTSGLYYRIIACSREAYTYAELLEDMQELPMQKEDYDKRVRSRLVYGGKVVQPRAIVMMDVKFAT